MSAQTEAFFAVSLAAFLPPAKFVHLARTLNVNDGLYF